MNFATLNTYNQTIDAYIRGTPAEVSDGVKVWIDKTVKLIPSGATIMEIGSAFGRDAKYMEEKGFTVERTDGAENFVSLLQKSGYAAFKFNILTDSFNKSYALIFANAVFLHFTREEFKAILPKIYNALLPYGILSFSVKEGVGEAWTSEKVDAPRFFCYWQKEPLQELLTSAGFTVVEIEQDRHFLQVIAQKPN